MMTRPTGRHGAVVAVAVLLAIAALVVRPSPSSAKLENFELEVASQAATTEDEVLQISATRHVLGADGGLLQTDRTEYLVDRKNGRYRATRYDSQGHVTRELSVLGVRKVAHMPRLGGAILRTAASQQDPMLREVDYEIWSLQNLVNEGRATVVGSIELDGRTLRRVHLRSEVGEMYGTLDPVTGMTTGWDLPGGGRLDIQYDQLVSLPASTVDDSQFEIAIPPDADLQIYEELSPGAALPPYGVFWLGPTFAGTELKKVLRYATVPRRPNRPPATDTVHAIYGEPGVLGSRLVEVIAEPLPSEDAQQAGRTVQPGVVYGIGPARMGLIRGNSLVRLLGRDEAEVRAMEAALRRLE